jgi:hypothetical protein
VNWSSSRDIIGVRHALATLKNWSLHARQMSSQGHHWLTGARKSCWFACLTWHYDVFFWCQPTSVFMVSTPANLRVWCLFSCSLLSFGSSWHGKEAGERFSVRLIWSSPGPNSVDGRAIFLIRVSLEHPKVSGLSWGVVNLCPFANHFFRKALQTWFWPTMDTA